MTLKTSAKTSERQPYTAAAWRAVKHSTVAIAAATDAAVTIVFRVTHAMHAWRTEQ